VKWWAYCWVSSPFPLHLHWSQPAKGTLLHEQVVDAAQDQNTKTKACTVKPTHHRSLRTGTGWGRASVECAPTFESQPQSPESRLLILESERVPLACTGLCTWGCAKPALQQAFLDECTYDAQKDNRHDTSS
jgi:hypothetical protein